MVPLPPSSPPVTLSSPSSSSNLLGRTRTEQRRDETESRETETNEERTIEGDDFHNISTSLRLSFDLPLPEIRPCMRMRLRDRVERSRGRSCFIFIDDAEFPHGEVLTLAASGKGSKVRRPMARPISDMKMNAIRSTIVVLGALAFGHLSLQIGFKPYLEEAKQQALQQLSEPPAPSQQSHFSDSDS